MIDIEERELRAIQRECERNEMTEAAIASSLKAHPIVACVKNHPYEKSVLPAYKYLRAWKRRGGTWWEPCPPGKAPKPEEIDDYIEWVMPAHDLTRPRRKHCGLMKTQDRELVFERCGGDYTHYTEARRRHCWSLSCPECFYDTAVKNGVKVEKHCKRYEELWKKKGTPVAKPHHIVVSPPQDLIKSVMQTRSQYDELCRIMWRWLEECGAIGGVCFFHPWRQQKEEWNLGPHFHWVIYGFVRCERFKSIHQGWVAKDVHKNQPIHSITYTVAYISTHRGVPCTAKNPYEVDWDKKLIRYLARGIFNPKGDYTDEDYDKYSRGKGRIAGDISDVDWLAWTEDVLVHDMRIRYWGELSRNKFVTIGKHRTYRYKCCKHCGNIITVHNGQSDLAGSKVEYIQDDMIVAFASDAKEARLEYENYKKNQDKISFDEFIANSKIMVCDSEYYHNSDPMVKKFDRPDSFYLKRQEDAFGPSDD